LIGGLWHGAAWTFVLWGVFHGLILIAFRPFENRRKARQAAGEPESGFPIIIRVLITFHLVCFGWLLFRADSLHQVGLMLGRIGTSFEFTKFTRYGVNMMAFFALPFMLYEYWLEKKNDVMALVHVNWLPRGLVYAYLVLMLQVFPADIPHAFIYFQF